MQSHLEHTRTYFPNGKGHIFAIKIAMICLEVSGSRTVRRLCNSNSHSNNNQELPHVAVPVNQ